MLFFSKKDLIFESLFIESSSYKVFQKIFLALKSKTTDYEWYIKPHRDYLPGTLEILNSFIPKFKNLKIINPDTSFHQLKKEGIKNILTCYGSVGHELPLLGFNVINAGYNPHINFE